MPNNIKKMIAENHIIICDTNVFLHIYRYSPEFSDFALQCIQAVSQSIIIPSTVDFEFHKHYRKYFGDMGKRVARAASETQQQLAGATHKVLNICENLRALQYPDIEKLQGDLKDKFDELSSISEEYFKDKTILEFIANPWSEKDLVLDLMNNIRSSNQIMQTVTRDEIYQICEEGEKRYNAKPPVPPGFKDGPKKDGVKKYSDLIMWKEVLRYAKTKSVNVIFVTDDVKSDWWIQENASKRFHPQLIAEFEKETGMKIVPQTSLDFLADTSMCYGITQTDAVGIALRMTDTDYFERVSDMVFDSICDDLCFSGEDYIDTSSAHIGTEGITELEVEDHEFVSAKQVERDEDFIVYEFVFKVSANGTSFDYWGRDDDTKEVILGPSISHSFEGDIRVEVTREADMYLDFEADAGFEKAQILSGDLKETEYQTNYERDYDIEDAYSTCPDCGQQINCENDGGDGFCTKCSPNH